ncbi:MAG: septal ring lytic transglycosylase RlpA family protein [Glycocaulis sp.]
MDTLTVYSLARAAAGMAVMLLVSACASIPEPDHGPVTRQQVNPAAPVQMAGAPAPDPLTEAPREVEEGIASWYGARFHGRLTANGEVYDMDALTAAHPSLPMPSLARVTRLDTGASVIVRINDRGPFVEGRIIDLSRAAAEALAFVEDGLAEVRVEAFGPADAHDRAAVSGFLPRRTAPSAVGAAN